MKLFSKNFPPRRTYLPLRTRSESPDCRSRRSLQKDITALYVRNESLFVFVISFPIYLFLYCFLGKTSPGPGFMSQEETLCSNRNRVSSPGH